MEESIHTYNFCPTEERERANIQPQRWRRVLTHSPHTAAAATAESASGLLPYMSGSPPRTHRHTHSRTHMYTVHVATSCQKRRGAILLNFSTSLNGYTQPHEPVDFDIQIYGLQETVL